LEQSQLLCVFSGFSSLAPTEMQKALPLVPSLQSNWLMMHVEYDDGKLCHTLILGSFQFYT
jgi:hypothetical protein